MPMPFEHDFFEFTPPETFRVVDPATGMRVLYVHAYFNPFVEVDSIYPDDWMAPGIYQVLVPAEMEDGVAAMCAYMTFQYIIPVKYVDDIELTVRDPYGLELVPDFACENPVALVARSGPLTKLLPAAHLACRPGWIREEYARRQAGD